METISQSLYGSNASDVPIRGKSHTLSFTCRHSTRHSEPDTDFCTVFEGENCIDSQSAVGGRIKKCTFGPSTMVSGTSSIFNMFVADFAVSGLFKVNAQMRKNFSLLSLHSFIFVHVII